MNQINTNLNIFNSYRIPVLPSFRSVSGVETIKTQQRNDSFVSNPLTECFPCKSEIESIARSNPQIMSILRENNLPLKVNEKALNDLQNGHLKETRILSAQIASNLPDELKSEVDMKALQEAAMYHDIGKVLIPDKILNKNGKLNDEEWKIMKLHPELSYEIAKTKGLSEKTLEIIRYHHQNELGTGYPAVDENYEHDINTKILAAADKYSALSEERSYKKSLSKEESLALMSEAVNNGLISEESFNALKKAV